MAARAIVGVLRQAQLRNVQVRTFVVERLSPLGEKDQAYLLEAIFRDHGVSVFSHICLMTTIWNYVACAIRPIRSSRRVEPTFIFCRCLRSLWAKSSRLIGAGVASTV